MPHTRKSLFPKIAFLLAAALCCGATALAMDPNVRYEIEAPYPDIPLRGPKKATGLVIWSHGVKGFEVAYQYPPPYIAKVLAKNGWDVFRIKRNPAFETGWESTGKLHAATAASQAASARDSGYRRIILGGESYGGAISLEAARAVPVFGVIALVPGTGQHVKDGEISVLQSSKIEKDTYEQLRTFHAERALFVMPPDDEYMPDINRSANTRQIMNGRGIPYMMVDRQVHGHGGGGSRDFAPFAGCSLTFFDPGFMPKPGEFQCYRDEAQPLLAKVGLTLDGATAAWFGYFEGAGTAIVLVEHRTAGVSTVDYAHSADILGRSGLQTLRHIPAQWLGNDLVFGSANSTRVTVHPGVTTGEWSLTMQSPNHPEWRGKVMLLTVATPPTSPKP